MIGHPVNKSLAFPPLSTTFPSSPASFHCPLLFICPNFYSPSFSIFFYSSFSTPPLHISDFFSTSTPPSTPAYYSAFIFILFLLSLALFQLQLLVLPTSSYFCAFDPSHFPSFPPSSPPPSSNHPQSPFASPFILLLFGLLSVSFLLLLFAYFAFSAISFCTSASSFFSSSSPTSSSSSYSVPKCQFTSPRRLGGRLDVCFCIVHSSSYASSGILYRLSFNFREIFCIIQIILSIQYMPSTYKVFSRRFMD